MMTGSARHPVMENDTKALWRSITRSVRSGSGRQHARPLPEVTDDKQTSHP